MDRYPWLDEVPSIDPAWFRRPGGIHGVGHTTRVTAHAIALCDELEVDETVRHAVVHAGIWHDIGRTHEHADLVHGALSVDKATQLGLAAGLEPAARELAFFAMEFHCIADEVGDDYASGLGDPERARQALWVLKDGDALDRVRLRGQGLDPRQLRFDYSHDLIAVAEMLLAIVR